MNKSTLIIAGGVFSKHLLQECLERERFDYIIAVDGAIDYIEEVGLSVHCIVGDFDTVNAALLNKYIKKKNLYVEQHRPEKDETDTELALHIAMKRGSKKITILGATGGRLDHFIGNLHLLLQPLQREIPCVLLDQWNRIRLINHNMVLSEKDAFGTYISFLPFTDEVQDVSLIGFKYPLYHRNLKKGNTLGVSNERIASEARIHIGNGILICIESRDMGKQALKIR